MQLILQCFLTTQVWRYENKKMWYETTSLNTIIQFMENRESSCRFCIQTIINSTKEDVYKM